MGFWYGWRILIPYIHVVSKIVVLGLATRVCNQLKRTRAFELSKSLAESRSLHIRQATDRTVERLY